MLLLELLVELIGKLAKYNDASEAICRRLARRNIFTLARTDVFGVDGSERGHESGSREREFLALLNDVLARDGCERGSGSESFRLYPTIMIGRGRSPTDRSTPFTPSQPPIHFLSDPMMDTPHHVDHAPCSL